MTNFNTPSDITNAPAPSCAEISPSELGAYIRAAIIRIWVYMSKVPLGRGALRGRLDYIRHLLASLFEAELDDYHAILRGALVTDPQWQANVREDLGGETAMTAWQARFDRAQAALEITPRDDIRESLPQLCSQTKRKSGGVKTDRDGLFRMEAIARKAWHDSFPKRQTGSGRTSTPPRQRLLKSFRLPLTPLRAEDLRAAADMGRAIMSRIDIAKWGEAITHEQVQWAQRLRRGVICTAPSWEPAKAPP